MCWISILLLLPSIKHPNMKSGPIIIIENDDDDKVILEDIFKELGLENKLAWFLNCMDAMEYLISLPDPPFLILCDVNMPQPNGVKFKEEIDKHPELRKKSIPFVFYSYSSNKYVVNEAFMKMSVQGFFVKKSNYAEIKNDIRLIVEYWQACVHPG